MSEQVIHPEVISVLPERADPRHSVPLKDKLLNSLNRSTSENTREAYQRAILEFHRCAGKHLLSVTPREVLAWCTSSIKMLNWTLAESPALSS